MDPRFIKPKENFNIPWLPTRMELFNVLDSNYSLADFKVLVLSRIIVMLRLGTFSDIPHSVQLSLKGSVSVFHTKFMQKLSKAGNLPETFVEKEKIWLNMDIWLDKDTKRYISDPVAYISKEPQSKENKKSNKDTDRLDPIEKVWVLPEVNYDTNEDVRIQAGFIKNDDGEWEGLTLKKVKKKEEEDASKKIKRTYIKSGRYRGRGRGGRRGRPAKPYEALSERSQRRQSYQLSKYHTVEELLGAAYHGSHKIYRHDVARNVRQIREIYAGPPLKNLPKPIPPIVPFSPNEVVNWVIDSGITKRCYQELRLTCKAKKANIFPSYNHIANAKIACYPKTIHVNQIVAEIPLQSLLNHTAERVVVLNKEEVGKMKPERGRLKLNLVLKWGYDSSSGTSEWRQRFLSDSMRDGSDADLFCVSLVPLSLRHPDGVIWHNPTPANSRFGRPLSVQLGKEAPELAYESQAKVEAQIQDLQPAFFVVDLDEKIPTFEDDDEDSVKETHKVTNADIIIPNSINSSNSYGIPSSIGSNTINSNTSIGNMLGGVPSNLGRKSSSKKSCEDKRVEVEVYFLLQHTVVEPVSNHGSFGSFTDKDPNCHICVSDHEVLSQFNITVAPNAESHKYIASKNQVWQNCFDTMVNLASFIPQESWAGRVDVSARIAQRKVDIHKAFKKELGLIVDKCKSGNVSNNDAMQIRKAFQSEEEFSRLTGVDRKLLHRFNVILTAMSLDYEINTDEFGAYCRATADYFSQVYRWFQLPTIVHKLLYHGKAMAEEFIIPIGMMSEEAQLARNRDSKSFFQRHAKKESTEQILMQVIKHMMVLGDPVMSQADLETRKTKQNWKFYRTNKRLVFDEDVQKLLLAPTQFDERKKLMRHRNQLYKKNKMEREQKQERQDPIALPTLAIDTSNVQDLSVSSQPSTSKQTIINRTQLDIKPGVTYEILATPDLTNHIPGLLGARQHIDLSSKTTLNRTTENQPQGNIISMTTYEDSGITYQNNGTAKITYNFPTLLELAGQDATSRLRNPHPHLVQYAPATTVTTTQTTYNTVTGTFPVINFPYHQ